MINFHTSSEFNLVCSSSQEIVFIDRGVEDYGFLVQGIRPGIEVHLLDADAIAQMTAVLSSHQSLKAVHVVSHASPGCLYLGETELSLSTLEQYAAYLQSWFAGYAKGQTPELLLYGCNAAAGDAGAELLDKLKSLTGADIAASKDRTGHAKHQGNWSLTVQRGAVTAISAFAAEVMASYPHSLNWVQLGQDIDGEATGDAFGRWVSLSADGSTVGIAAIGNDGNGENAGHVRLFRRNAANQWVQLGQDINGEATGDNQSVMSVSLSADGSTIAVGAASGNPNEINTTGQVKLYRLNTANQWIQLGQDINGEAIGDNSGYSISFSADGSTVAIGASGNDSNGNNAGRVKLYRLNAANQWEQLGQSIDGKAVGDRAGHSVSLSADGSIVALSAPNNPDFDPRFPPNVSPGQVRLYRLNTSNRWEQLGQDINGEANNDISGWWASLSGDGSTVAIGARLNNGNGSSSGHVRLYRLNASNQWIQLGQDLDGVAAEDQSGRSVSLSADGSTVAIGAPLNDSNGSNSGHVRLYQLNSSNQWVQFGQSINGEAAGDWSGYSVSVSADGSRLTIGAPFNDGNNGADSGHVRVYNFEDRPLSIVWNTRTGAVSSMALNVAAATASLTSIGRSITDTNWALQTVGDMNGDGQADVLLRNATLGQNLVWYMNIGGQSIKSEALIGRDIADANWSIAGTGDMDGDGKTDIILRNQAADQIVAWYMDGAGNILSESLVGRGFGDNNWKIEAMADFNGDNKADILLRNRISGQNLLWEMDKATILAESLFGRDIPDVNWNIEGASDFDSNGTVDVLVRNGAAGQALLWSMADKNTIGSEVLIANVPGADSQIVF